MSYRKKRSSRKQNHVNPTPEVKEYSGAGDDRILSTARLTSGLPYQRPVKEKDVNRLITEWDDRLMEPLTVSFRDRKFYVIDGQNPNFEEISTSSCNAAKAQVSSRLKVWILFPNILISGGRKNVPR